jgi:SAM-dependent methyltransferase
VGSQRQVNDAVWGRSSRLVAEYANRTLRPVETVLLDRYRDALSGRVLELGCGAGRLTGYLLDLSADVRGIDVMPAMVEYCRAAYPRGDFAVADLRDIGGGPYDAVVAAFNVLDVLDHAERRDVLARIAGVLSPGGLLVMSSHNLAAAGSIRSPGRVLERSPRRIASNLRHLPARLRNARRLRRHERTDADWAIRNDEALDFGLLHYYVTRDACERQLAAAGLTLVECLDIDGRPVAPGEQAAYCTELHYVART